MQKKITFKNIEGLLDYIKEKFIDAGYKEDDISNSFLNSGEKVKLFNAYVGKRRGRVYPSASIYYQGSKDISVAFTTNVEHSVAFPGKTWEMGVCHMRITVYNTSQHKSQDPNVVGTWKNNIKITYYPRGENEKWEEKEFPFTIQGIDQAIEFAKSLW